MKKKKTKNNSRHTDRTYIMLFHDAMDSLAWRALSHGAKALYLRLRRRYNGTIDNNGKVYLPQRMAVLEVNSNRDQIARWFEELQYYGFIVMVSAGHLGVHGRGRAACWRLTEVPYNGEPPTRDYLASAFRSKNQKQNPGPEIRAKVAPKSGPRGRDFQKPHLAPKSGPTDRPRNQGQI